jgi:hypothetical protein
MREDRYFREFLPKLVGRSKRALKMFSRKLSKFELQKDSAGMVQAIREMAETGIGTDACLEGGCLPMLVHYYSPVPDIKDLEQRKVWDRQSDLAGIHFCPDRQVAFLAELGKAFGHECHWPRTPTKDPLQFFTDNGSFSFGCAAGLHCILRYFKPRRVIEIGSGHSSLVISNALRLNAGDAAAVPCEYIIIDPYPGEIIRRGLHGVTRLIDERVELVDVEFFDQLGESDVLFVDSSHVVRTGGDVNYLVLDVLPRLKSGVIVHFHDISLPYEYNKIYFTNPGFRVFWTEAYLLQAFLSLNSEFEILMAMNYLMTDCLKDFCAAFPHFDPGKNWANSGSFWIRRKHVNNRRGLLRVC